MQSLSTRLFRWYDVHGRRLPWRRTRDAYRILVSEIMLQQTQVTRVLEYYGRWLKQFPSWEQLAQASNAAVIHAWAGLGYNRRGLMLRDMARTIVAQGLPETEAAWRALKGIGPYTAAALTVFSLHQRATPIDTNIRRVASRLLFGIPFPDPKQDTRLAREMTSTLMSSPRFYDVPQALFDLASTVCTKQPACNICPLRTTCKAAPKFLSGRVRIPKAMIKKAHETKHRNKKFPDRIYRGRILAEIRQHPTGVLPAQLGPRIDPTFDTEQDQAWLLRMLDRLQRDHFIIQKDTHFVISNR